MIPDGFWAALRSCGRLRLAPSSDDVGAELILDALDAILQGEFALLQALDQQLIGQRCDFERCNLGVEIAMLAAQPRQFFAQFAFVVACHAVLRPSTQVGRPAAVEGLGRARRTIVAFAVSGKRFDVPARARNCLNNMHDALTFFRDATIFAAVQRDR